MSGKKRKAGKKRTALPRRSPNPIQALAVRVQEIVNDEIIAYRAGGPGWEPHQPRLEEVARLAEGAFAAGVQAGIEIPLLETRIRLAVEAVDGLLHAAMAGIDLTRPARPRPSPEEFGKATLEGKDPVAALEEDCPEWKRIEKPVDDTFKACEGLLVLAAALDAKLQQDADDEPTRHPIPPDWRTRPLNMAEAAALMGYTRTRNIDAAVRALRCAMKGGEMRSDMLNRQQYVFDRRDFPAEAQEEITPK